MSHNHCCKKLRGVPSLLYLQYWASLSCQKSSHEASVSPVPPYLHSLFSKVQLCLRGEATHDGRETVLSGLMVKGKDTRSVVTNGANNKLRQCSGSRIVLPDLDWEILGDWGAGPGRAEFEE